MTITTNGVFTIGDNSTIVEANTDNGGYPPLLPTYTLNPGTMCVYWQYMYNSGVPGQGVYWQVYSRSLLAVEWLLHDQADNLVNVIMTYNANAPGKVTYYYFTDDSTGQYSTIGVQGVDNQNSKYSYPTYHFRRS